MTSQVLRIFSNYYRPASFLANKSTSLFKSLSEWALTQTHSIEFLEVRLSNSSHKSLFLTSSFFDDFHPLIFHFVIHSVIPCFTYLDWILTENQIIYNYDSKAQTCRKVSELLECKRQGLEKVTGRQTQPSRFSSRSNIFSILPTIVIQFF